MSWQERRCNAEGFGRPKPFFFLCEERTYSPPAKQAVVSLLRRVVRSARRMRLLREPPDNATSPAGTAVIACGAQSGLVHFEPDHFGTLRKPATGSFIAVMDGAYCPSIFFFGKETKTRVRHFSVPRKGRNNQWQSIIWKQRL